jgi:arylformamidase
MKKIIDISLSISAALPVWPGDPPVWIERTSKMEEGGSANVTALRFGAHTGTHMDAPYHFLENGRTIDEIALEELIGLVQVLEIDAGVDLITAPVLDSLKIDPAVDKILFKTRNSILWSQKNSTFFEDYVAIDESAAHLLVNMGFHLVGIDYLSVAPYGDQTPVHRILLGSNVILLEGLNLADVQPGLYTLLCLPLKLAGSDGAPARAALLVD